LQILKEEIALRPFRILLIDDDQNVCHLLQELLVGAGYDVSKAETGQSALQLIESEVFDAALLDVHLPDMTGLQVLGEIKRRDPGMDAVMMTGYPELGSAVEALRLGAYDYLTKPVEWVPLERLLQRVTERRYLRDEVTQLRSRLADNLGPGVGEFIGTSPGIQNLRDQIGKVGPTDSSVLIQGESGTGKELIAYAIHGLSHRKKKPFIPVHCAAIPPELMEGELFGYVKGAFPSATSDSRGLFRSAEGGTLFLDEVAEFPMALQPKLLRALQEKEVRPIGSAQAHRVDVRIIASSNQDLEDAVRSGKFRQDLYFRLNVVRLDAPPLRSIKEDIPLIAMHSVRKLNRRFARRVRNIAPSAMNALMAYDFPGNVRELETIIERAYALGADDEITSADLPRMSSNSSHSFTGIAPSRTLDDLERELVAETLRANQNDKSKTAEALGMSERTLYRRIKKHGIS
jgi:DNA-binding NtrC family response regulator